MKFCHVLGPTAELICANEAQRNERQMERSVRQLALVGQDANLMGRRF